jgi:Ca2+-binding EF-hand superfamily protein
MVPLIINNYIYFSLQHKLNTLLSLIDLRQAFGLFDKEGNGVVTTKEIGNVLRNLGQYPSEKELNDMLDSIDIDGDGTFSFEEFVQLMYNMGNLSEISEEEEDKELKDAFRVIK